MPLAAGTRIGPYEVLAPLGAGGMGEVYRAVETRLGRHVAVKISTGEFTGRFRSEARPNSAHPHICTLYEVGPNFLVMELVEGETLAAPFEKGEALDEGDACSTEGRLRRLWRRRTPKASSIAI